MNNRNDELRAFLQPGRHVHLVGIGGVSMRPLGLVLQGMGLVVTGSDMNASVSTDELIAKGQKADLPQILKEIKQRDHQDMTRPIAPLKQAKDAVLVDTSELDIEGVIAAIRAVIAEKVKL